MFESNTIKNKILILITIYITFNVVEYYGGNYIEELVSNVPTGNLKFDVILNNTAFKIFELFLASIMGIIFPVPIYFKIRFSRRTVKWLFVLLIISILLCILKSEYLLEAIFIGIAAAITEEYIFRGIFLGYLLKIFKFNSHDVYISLAISTLFFSVYHFGNILNQNIGATLLQMIGVGGIGFMFGCLYVKTGSLLISMITHFFFDYYVTIMNGMELSYKTQQLDSSNLSTVIIQFFIFLFIGLVILNPSHADGWRLNKLMDFKNLSK
ncbi:CPBP family intramembrane metalloprotease [Leuconostoc citreum]